MSLSTLLLIIALIVFVVAAIGMSYKKVDLIAAGLALIGAFCWYALRAARPLIQLR